MWGLILYVIAVVTMLILFMVYKPNEEKSEVYEVYEPRYGRHDYRLSSMFAILGLDTSNFSSFQSFRDHFQNFQEVSHACKRAGLEKTQLVIGIDFTASNEWQGRKTFGGNCLHKIIPGKIQNPYQKVIAILGQTLEPFDEDRQIPAYGFGDSTTLDHSVFPFKANDLSCDTFVEVLELYNEVARKVALSGPTSFAPLIHKSIEIVKARKAYHILVIVADGQVTEEQPTIDAIVEASKHPLSIIVVGVGDGPWDIMEEFDDQLPKRRFDNFQFVNYHDSISKAKSPDAAFALQCLMEIPDQYKTIRALGYLTDFNGQSNYDKELPEVKEVTDIREADCPRSRSNTPTDV